MHSIKRIFVEKKRGLDTLASEIFNDLKNNLGIKELLEVRLLNCYDFCGIDDEFIDICKNTIFSEPPVDNIYDEIKIGSDEIIFCVKLLPGQYDQRADSCIQCIQIVTGKQTHLVEVTKVYILKGNISKEQLTKIKGYLINPIESMEVAFEKPKSLGFSFEKPEKIKTIDNFIDFTKSEINEFHKKNSLAMSIEDLIFCQQYFKDEKRNPTETEIKVIDTYWSDHCRHTTFSTVIEDVEFEDGVYYEIFNKAFELYENERKEIYKDKESNITLMNMATIGMKALRKKGLLNDLDESEEINACSIVVDVDVDNKNEQWLVMFKNETHNHPTEIEPFGGAATCLGGAIRDPLSGRSYVYQAMRVTGSADPRKKVEDTLPHKLPQRKITIGASDGYSSYGNQIGLATGLVKEIYHEDYVAKRMEIGAVVGAVKKENVVRDTPKLGDVVIVVGGRTGRDGCGGATGSSKEHDEESIIKCGSEVQKGNPPVERKLQRLFRNPECSKLIKRCNDFGAGGVSVAVSELADGVVINLDCLLKKYEGLDGTELAISESQERMAVVIDKDDKDRFIEFAENENLEAVEVAHITDEKRLVMTWQGDVIVDISRDFLNTNGVLQYAKVKVSNPEKFKIDSKSKDIKENWLNNLKDLNVCSQKGLIDKFDGTIGARSVLMPFGGKYQLTQTESMAALIPVLEGETKTATIMSFGYNPFISKWSPFHGAVFAIVESISKIVASGGDYKKVRLSFQEYFERLGYDSEKWGKPFISLLGSIYAQLNLGIPAIGGKDSMSGTFKDINVPPTLVSFSIGTSNADNIISPEFKKISSKIIKLTTNYTKDDIPDFNELIKNFELITSLIENKKIISCHTIGIGGIAGTISKMSMGNKIGAEINCNNLFNEEYGSFVIEFTGDLEELRDYNYTVLGETIQDESIIINGIKITLEEIINTWLNPLEDIFPTGIFEEYPQCPNIKSYKNEIKIQSKIKIAKPRVFIPVFPGTNCEYDSKQAFEKAGAVVETFVINNLDVTKFESSVKEMSEKINNSQIIMFPGGFSSGDEPDGSGKFIASVFRNSYIKESVLNLLNNRDGLILGICNGFQALIKLGLLPYGDIKIMNENSPTLTFNKIGRHVSTLARTKIVSNKSPWLYNTEVGEIHTIPISHGEGRFICDEDTINNLINNYQIATKYVDFNDNPTYNIESNPNYSFYAVEGITSPDGRIFGKMGHSERIGQNLYKNVLGNYNQKIFKSGVEYFS